MTDEQIVERLRDKSTWENGWQYRNGELCELIYGKRRPPYVYISIAADDTETYHDVGGWASVGHDYDLIPRPVKRKGWAGARPGL